MCFIIPHYLSSCCMSFIIGMCCLITYVEYAFCSFDTLSLSKQEREKKVLLKLINTKGSMKKKISKYQIWYLTPAVTSFSSTSLYVLWLLWSKLREQVLITSSHRSENMEQDSWTCFLSMTLICVLMVLTAYHKCHNSAIHPSSIHPFISLCLPPSDSSSRLQREAWLRLTF